MSSTPSVIVFDVNETLSDTSSLSARFGRVGIPGHLARPWFAALLRDGFALAAAGGSRPFAEVGADALATVLHDAGVPAPDERVVEFVLASFSAFPVHDDVTEGLRALRGAGHRLVTLTNGSRRVSEDLLAAAGVRGEFEALLSVEGAPTWKPGPGAYRYALDHCGVQAADALLVAVHPWDVHGAAAAGLRTAWIDRDGAPYPRTLTAPGLRATDLLDLASQLGRGPLAPR